MTYGKLADDIILRVYNGVISNDSQLEKRQVIWWLSTYRDQIVQGYLNSLLKDNKPLDTFYVEREAVLVADDESTSGINDEDERIFVTVTKQPMGLLNDLGVVRVTTDDNVKLDRTRLENVDMIAHLKYAKPTAKNPVWYRDNRKIILQGVSYKNVAATSYIVEYVPTQASQTITETTEVKISDELLPILLETVEQVGLREIYSTVEDTSNNGADDTNK